MADIRIDITFWMHFKRRRLEQQLGAQGVLCLINLWLATAANNPDGNLRHMSPADIALYAQWPGDPKAFCSALVETKFLDVTEDGGFVIHEWKEHQPWVCHARERSELARKAAQRRWDQKRARQDKAKGGGTDHRMQTASSRHAERIAPLPSPSPTEQSNTAESDESGIIIGELIHAYSFAYHQRFRAEPRVTDGDRAALRAELEEHSPEEIRDRLIAHVFSRTSAPSIAAALSR